MSATEHWAVFIDNTSDKSHLIHLLLEGNLPEPFKTFQGKNGTLFSPLAVERFMDEEDRHGIQNIDHRFGTISQIHVQRGTEKGFATLYSY